MKKVYIIGGARTPIAVSRGKFANIRPEILGSTVSRELCRRYNLADKLAGVIAGNAVGTGGNIARLMALEAGLSESVPALTVDVQCASGLESVALAYSKIAANVGDIYLAGGMESASLQPARVYDVNDERYTSYDGGRYMTAQFSPDILSETVMLEGAERVIAEDAVTADELNEWVIRSHARANKAREENIFADIIVPTAGLSFDDGISKRMSAKLLNRLPRVLGKDTLTNAGNACRINDGAAFVALTGEDSLAKFRLPLTQPIYRILSAVEYGGNPLTSPRGAMAAADKLLAEVGMTYDKLAAIEFNEAFAVIDVLFERRCPELRERYNTFGGALAYGHPYGASGAIILLHLMKALELSGGRYGLASIAGAGGMGVAMLIECEGRGVRL